MNIEQLETKRLLLIPVSMNDEKAYLEHFVDYEVIKFLSSAVPWPYPDDGVKFFLEEIIAPYQGKTRWTWGIHIKGRDKGLVGAIDLFKEGKPENRGFWLGKEFWGHSYMSEAAAVVNDYAFNQLGFKELIFSNAVGNHASHKVKEKTGAKFQKIIESKFVDPIFTQSEIWSQTKEEWEKFKNESLNSWS